MSVLQHAFARAACLSRRVQTPRVSGIPKPLFYRSFHVSSRKDDVKPFLLADIGEGITECQLIQWFVQPGARVEQFDKLCEVQSDKASVEITSPFDGVIKKLHYEPDDMAITGKPLVDIDIQSEISEADEAKVADIVDEVESQYPEQNGANWKAEEGEQHVARPLGRSKQERSQRYLSRPDGEEPGTHATLATPAVRHLTKELNVEIKDVPGTGRDGRVLKEDVHRYVSQSTQQPAQSLSCTQPISREDRKVQLTPVQNQMFKTMTRSLQIPHFLYTCGADLASVTALRTTLNASRPSEPKLTHLPFVIKAVSLALQYHPLLNSALDTSDPKKPALTYRIAHNIGVAVDTPSGLVVPVLRNVQDLSIMQIASKLRELSESARNNKSSPSDFSGATFTVSNIGSVGGGVVAAIISEPQVAVLGVGRSKVVPAFNENDTLVKREELVLSWCADHRVVDGAECARCAERVRSLLEDPGNMLLEMR